MTTSSRTFEKQNSRNKKIVAAIFAAIMIISVLSILSVGTQPSFAASGSVNYDPVVFSHSSSSTIVLSNGGSFASDSTVKFYASSSTSFSSSDTVIGTYALTGGGTTLSNAQVTFNTNSLATGSWYVAASDDSGLTFTGSSPITVTSLNPTLSLSPTVTKPGTTVTVTGSGFDVGSSVTLYLNCASGTVLVNSFAASRLNVGVTFTVPTNIPGSSTGMTYHVVAQESSPSSPNYGITADTSFSLTPSVTISPVSTNGAVSSSFTVYGYGFSAGDSFSASTQTSPVPTIQFAGVDALNPSFTSSSTGSFTVGVTGLSSSISLSTYSGPQQISVRDSTPVTYTGVGSIIISQTNPSSLGFSFSVTATTGNTFNVNDSVVATIWNFPASQFTSFWLGNTEVGSVTTDSNGAAQLATVVPSLPGGTYTPVSVDAAASLTTSPTTGLTSYTISPFFRAVDPSGSVLIAGTSSTGEYVPPSGIITIQAYGLNPVSSAYDFYDSIAAPASGPSGGIYGSGLVDAVTVGSESASNLLQPSSNGTLIFTYSPGYSSESTGTAGTITSANGVLGYDSNNYAYYAIGAATISFPTSYGIIKSGSTGQGLTVSGLIPYTAALYPGVSNQYNAFIGNTELILKFTNHNGVSTTGTVFDNGDSSISYDAPSLSGLFDLNITYNGQSAGSASIGVQPVVLSLAGNSPGDGTLVVRQLSAAGQYEVVGYGYEATSSLNLYYATYGNTPSSHRITLPTSNGAFATVIVPGPEPVGTYSVFSVITSSGINYYQYSSYSVSAVLTLDSSTSPSGTVGDQVSVSASGLVTTPGYYALYFGSKFIEYSSSGGNFGSFNVPVLLPGNYSVTVRPIGSTSAIASQNFEITSNPKLMIATDSNYAFPGELVQFTATVGASTPPTLGTSTVTTYSAAIAYTLADIYLNGTLFTQVPAYYSSNEITGSFQMPNSAPGSYFELTVTGIPVYLIKGTTSATSGSYINYTYVDGSFANSQSDYLGLVSGAGALITGFNTTQLTATIDTAIHTSMQVPLSDLNASVTSISGLSANITTQFGTMSASLSAINAKISNVSLGVATVQTDVGQIKVSLSSLNSTVVALNGDTARISSAVGIFNTTINNINATVTISNGNLATIKTDLGTFTGNVTSVSNGIATIQTSLGTITANTQSTAFPSGMLFILEIVILVLAVIAVAFSALAMMNTRKKY